MCEPATLAAIGTTVASAVGTAVSTAPAWLPVAATGAQMLSSGIDAGNAAKASDEAAAAETANASERAQRLKAQGLKVLAEQRLAQVSSGLEGGTGSALEVGRQDAAELELDALTELYGGQTRATALRKQAKRQRAVARLMTGAATGAAAVLAGGNLWGAFGGGGGGLAGSGATGLPAGAMGPAP